MTIITQTHLTHITRKTWSGDRFPIAHHPLAPVLGVGWGWGGAGVTTLTLSLRLFPYAQCECVHQSVSFWADKHGDTVREPPLATDLAGNKCWWRLKGERRKTFLRQTLRALGSGTDSRTQSWCRRLVATSTTTPLCFFWQDVHHDYGAAELLSW